MRLLVPWALGRSGFGDAIEGSRVLKRQQVGRLLRAEALYTSPLVISPAEIDLSYCPKQSVARAHRQRDMRRRGPSHVPWLRSGLELPPNPPAREPENREQMQTAPPADPYRHRAQASSSQFSSHAPCGIHTALGNRLLVHTGRQSRASSCRLEAARRSGKPSSSKRRSRPRPESQIALDLSPRSRRLQATVWPAMRGHTRDETQLRYRGTRSP